MRLVYFANDKSRNHFYLKNHGPLCARSVFSKGLDKRTNINVMLKYRSPFKLGLSGLSSKKSSTLYLQCPKFKKSSARELK